MVSGKMVRAREGDFIETVDNLIFDVKGLIHPPDRTIAYIRYVESPLGDRVRGTKRYMKVYSLRDRDNLLREKYPQYVYYDDVFGEWLEGVPNNLIIKHYQPLQKTMELLRGGQLDNVEEDALKFIQELHDYSGVPLDYVGVSGSLLVGLHSQSSDIDIIIYGRKNSISAYKALRELLKREIGGFSPYNKSDLEKLYKFRSKDTLMPFNKFYVHESRKAFQGKFRGRDFFVRFVLEWNEVSENYGDRLYRRAGYARVRALVVDDSDSIFTPCVYRVSDAKVLEGSWSGGLLREIVSYRGRFCDQARAGETVIAQGKIERVIDRSGDEYYRMVIGASPSDFMVVKGL